MLLSPRKHAITNPTRSYRPIQSVFLLLFAQRGGHTGNVLYEPEYSADAHKLVAIIPAKTRELLSVSLNEFKNTKSICLEQNSQFRLHRNEKLSKIEAKNLRPHEAKSHRFFFLFYSNFVSFIYFFYSNNQTTRRVKTD